METQSLEPKTQTENVKNQLREWLMFAGFIGLYLVLQLWILPSFGVQT